jgi:NAD(P)-dependent dehydrogenase (short-subunit alcohol dehydrogenase family)
MNFIDVHAQPAPGNALTSSPTFARGDQPLTGTVALVTGGGRGLGLMLAHAFADAGASVALVARSADELAVAARLIERSGGTSAYVAADVTDGRALTRALDELEERLGVVDLLVNNAGIAGPIGPMWDNEPDAWWRTIEVNLRGVFTATQHVLPDMIARRHGRIINITSQAGAHRWPLVSSYSVSKAAVIKLSENLAHEVARHGINVFSVHPGLLPIGLTETVTDGPVSSVYEDHVRRWSLDELRLGRGADPDAAVELILRIAAGDADPLTGRHLSVHDDLDDLLARIDDVRRRDLLVMRPEPLSPTNHLTGGTNQP